MTYKMNSTRRLLHCSEKQTTMGICHCRCCQRPLTKPNRYHPRCKATTNLVNDVQDEQHTSASSLQREANNDGDLPLQVLPATTDQAKSISSPLQGSQAPQEAEDDTAPPSQVAAKSATDVHDEQVALSSLPHAAEFADREPKGDTALPNLGGAILAAGQYHTALVLEDGSIRVFGRNNFGQCTVPDLKGLKCTAVAAGESHTVLILEDGSVRTFGLNNCGQCKVPDLEGLKCTAVAAGHLHTVLIMEDGSVRTFGRNNYGQCTVPDLAGLKCKAVAAGGSHTLLKLQDNTFKASGLNDDGQCTVPAPGKEEHLSPSPQDDLHERVQELEAKVSAMQLLLDETRAEKLEARIMQEVEQRLRKHSEKIEALSQVKDSAAASSTD
eukprot:TRINITY_DN13021_c0_g1_i6.p1 TRINITY_DN13021_c0_g1~~TRINITY_DN13021_c0_g1_i6.p1  ORF type:complete len:383 (-),score=77.62 TRINITY_DN13021_c0_g1_i6:29-1177(-)